MKTHFLLNVLMSLTIVKRREYVGGVGVPGRATHDNKKKPCQIYLE